MVLCQWESIAGNLVLTTELKTSHRKLATVKGKKADHLSVRRRTNARNVSFFTFTFSTQLLTLNYLQKF